MISELISRIDKYNLKETSVIPWAAPIVSFGDISCAKVATLGLNPSNLEYVDSKGIELTGVNRRFHTLTSLNIENWHEINDEHIDLILCSCNDYFNHNPYDAWFNVLEKLFLENGHTYYGMFSDLVHLDLVPFVTEKKWAKLSHVQRSKLLEVSGDVLGYILRGNDIRFLVLNGQSVINHLEYISDVRFDKEVMPDWELPRKKGNGIAGYSYIGKLNRILSVDLEKEIIVLGFNHNLQSSFGVTKGVKKSIELWVSKEIGR
ncbi:hypothetical protein H4O21_03925 [Oceanospirillum sp. D5]|uniref:Uncharacterized protein n=1 Tax=Oceanospirillum sediminis TaxID=2760088 RepID=A0A839ILC4_9GAMM|nr:hypothetical protein [Oceanospirillum sediminis]